MNTRRDGEEPRAPARLVAAIKELPPRRVFVPPAIDRAILSAAEQHLAGGKARSAGMEWILAWRWRLAAATLCVVALSVSFTLFVQPSLKPRAFAREDLNRDGQVDILDAFQLSRELHRASSEMDLNGDGAVDGRDVEFLASRAVQLEKRS